MSTSLPTSAILSSTDAYRQITKEDAGLKRVEKAQKAQNCKVEMARCTINSKNLCIFALRGTCFPSKFSGSAVFPVVKGSRTDLHRFGPRRPYSIKTRIKTLNRKQRLLNFAEARRPYSIKTRIKTEYSLSETRLHKRSQTIFH